MKVVIISGGIIDGDFALDFLKKNEYDQLLVADSGLAFCRESGLFPDYIVGDFDSASPEDVEEFEKKGVKIRRLRPEKDDSDTQSTLGLAKELGADQVVILGATGGRLDHFWANVQLLAYGKAKAMEVALYDERNYISICDKSFTIGRKEQFGKYVSFFSLGDVVENLTLRGFKYPLTNHRLTNLDSGLTVSNELVEDTGIVSFTNGMLLMMQTRD